MPQLFSVYSDDRVVASLAKVVDDILLAGEPTVTDPLISQIDDIFKLGTICHGPGLLRLFCLNISQCDDVCISVDGEYNLESIKTAPISRFWHRDQYSPLNSIESKAFDSAKS